MAAREGDEMGGRRVDRYLIEELIGQGRLGVVYRAFDPELSLPVALRVLPAWISRESDAVDRFHALGRSLVTLRHPSILPAFRFGSDEGVLFVASRLANGGSLGEWLARSGQPLDPVVATWLIGAIAPGLDFAHQQGIVHGNVGSANVLLDDQRGPYLADFGLARLAWRPGPGQIDDPDTVAPEEIGTGSLGSASDRWALATLFYRLITGWSPSNAADAAGGAIPSVLTIIPTLPAEIDRVLGRVLASDPATRYPTATSFAEALWGIAGGRPGTLVPGIGLRGAAAALPALARLLPGVTGPINREPSDDPVIPPTVMMAPTLRERVTPPNAANETTIPDSAVAVPPPPATPTAIPPPGPASSSAATAEARNARRGLLLAAGLVAALLACGAVVWLVQAGPFAAPNTPAAGTVATVVPAATAALTPPGSSLTSISPTATTQPSTPTTALPSPSASATISASAAAGSVDSGTPTPRPVAPAPEPTERVSAGPSPSSSRTPVDPTPQLGPPLLVPARTPIVQPTITPVVEPPTGTRPAAGGPVTMPGFVGPGLFVPTNTPQPPTPTPSGVEEPRRPRLFHDPHHPISPS